MEDSIDFSTEPMQDVKDKYLASIEFLEKRNEELFFEIVCSE